MTKKQLKWYNAYCDSNATRLWDIYGSYSVAKSMAFDKCVETMYQYGGYNGKIIRHNANFFTYAFIYYESHVKHMCVITPYNRYTFALVP